MPLPAQDLVSANGVCSTWRYIAKELFFPAPWAPSPVSSTRSSSSTPLISHPAQLFSLCPRKLPSLDGSLLRCFVRRVPLSHKGSLCRFVLYQGADYGPTSSAQFLMSAQQTSK